MAGVTLNSQAVFNAASFARPAELQGHTPFAGESKTKSAVLIVDLQSFGQMEREDALAFSQALSKQITAYRASGIQPVWISIAPGGNKFLQPSAGIEDAESARDLLALEDMGFTGHQSQFSNHDVYAAFINDFGPRAHEPVYRKPSMSALATPEDAQEMTQILEQAGVKLESQKSSGDHPATKYIQPEQRAEEFARLFPEKETLFDYLRGNQFTDLIVLGAVSKYCVAETAVSSAVKGFNTRVDSGLSLTWSYPVTAATREGAQLVWAGLDHKALIEDAVSRAIDDPARSFTENQKALIRTIKIDDRSDYGEGVAKVFRNDLVSSPAA